MNQILISYKGGHQRVVNVGKEFFEDANVPVFNVQTKKMRVMSPNEKAVELALYLDPFPYTVELIKEGKSVVKHTYTQNKPEEYGNDKRTSSTWS